MKRTSVPEIVLEQRIKLATDDITEISTVPPLDPPNDSNVCCVIVAWRWLEFMKVVCSALPFQRISDWEVNPVPFTISKAGTTFAEMVPGDSDVRLGCITASVQLLKSMIAVQVQADSRAVRTRTRPMRQGLQQVMRQARTDASGR